MINKIDINNFGSFQDFSWDTEVIDSKGKVCSFKKLNILYGRNYSGKTTLSRIIRSLQIGELPNNYDSPSFIVTTDTGTVTQTDIPINDHHIRVYNKDFVDENLAFLRDSEGKITPFAIIGSENKTIEREISEKETKLGNVEEKKGLRYSHSIKAEELAKKQRAFNKAEIDLKDKLTKKATQSPNGIKHNTLYKDSNYNTPKIQADIDLIRRKSLKVLNEKDRIDKEKLLTEQPLPELDKKISFSSYIFDLYESGNKLITKKITPTEPIQELMDDAVLQAWVKEGIPQHRDKKTSCGFCGQVLPLSIWEKLDQHFSKESSDLEAVLEKQIEAVEQEYKQVDKIVSVETKELYSTFHDSFKKSVEELENELSNYKENLKKLTSSLCSRVKDIFTPMTPLEFVDNTKDISKKVKLINEIITNSNKKTESLSEDQNDARNELRLSEIAQFIEDIDLVGEEKKVSYLQDEASKENDEVSTLAIEISDFEKEIEKLHTKLKDEKKGAEKVNEYLNHYFGHEGLELEAIEDSETSTFKFQIMRGEDLAYNLSEGECSLVAFCYFFAKLEDDESKGKNLVIYIDDPISSLDSNHIFFMYSVIENMIARPVTDSSGNAKVGADGNKIYRYEQLFISTHNLEFLKYLKKLSRPKKNSEQFIVIGKEGVSTIEPMPSYLKNYVTEFNYLFGEIYICCDPGNATTEHHCFYNFGNNLRKFLEAFLFFKYPFSDNDQQDYNKRIEKFFKDKPGTDTLVQRLTNEHSHLGGAFDRSVQPIDHAEISKLAMFVFQKIKDNDKTQYECLLESINKLDPLK